MATEKVSMGHNQSLGGIIMKKTYLIGILIFVIIIIAIVRWGFSEEKVTPTPSQIERVLEGRMNAVREQSQNPIRNIDIAKEYGSKAITALAKYCHDSSSLVRHEAYGILWQIGISSKKNSERQKVVQMLIEGMDDEEQYVRNAIGRWLLSFQAKDFSETSKDLLHKQLTVEEPTREIILVCGVANMTSELPKLEKLLIDEKKYKGPGRWYGTIGWAARLARARMGSQFDISRCIELVEAEPDPVVRVTHLLKDLAYIRQPESINILQQYLESEERLPRVKKMFLGLNTLSML
jgi:hypothetical protein